MVIFTGGSWGVGEWQDNQLSGPGVAHYYFVDPVEDRAINLCQSSYSNYAQIDELTKFLRKYKHDDFDIFYWLVHNPLVDVPAEEIYTGHSSLATAIESILHKQLDYANTQAKVHGITVNLIGASCDLNDIDLSQYNNLNLVVPSWGQLIDPTYPASIFGHQADHMLELKLALEQHRPDLVEEYNKIGGVAFSKRRCMIKLKEMFYSFHPSSQAHKLLRDHLISCERK